MLLKWIRRAPKAPFLWRSLPWGTAPILSNALPGLRHEALSVRSLSSIARDSTVNQQPKALTVSLHNLHDCIGADVPLGTTTTACLTMKAADIREEQTRAPVNIVVCLDVSGSMSGDKLALCKVTLSQFIRSLSESDRFGLVTFSTEASLSIPLQLTTPTRKKLALQKVQALETQALTNISAALGLGLLELYCTGTPGIDLVQNNDVVRSVFLLTDGNANVGISDPEALAAFVRDAVANAADSPTSPTSSNDASGFFPLSGISNKKQQNEQADDDTANLAPVSLHCFGYGKTHNSELLVNLAQTSNGTYSFVEADKNVAGAIGSALGGIMSVVAQNVVVNFEVDPSATASGAEILDISYSEATSHRGGLSTVVVGDFYAEEERDVLVELKLPAASDPSDIPVTYLSATVGYSDVLQNKLVRGFTATAKIARPSGTIVSEMNSHVAIQKVRVSVARGINEAQTLAKQGDLAAAKSKLAGLRRDLDAAPTEVKNSDLVQQLDKDLRFIEEGIETTASYNTAGSKRMSHMFQSHRRQRSAHGHMMSDPGVTYLTPHKKSYLDTLSKAVDKEEREKK